MFFPSIKSIPMANIKTFLLNRKYLFLVFLFLISTGLFYWYEMRPARIRHDCSWVHVHEPARTEKIRDTSFLDEARDYANARKGYQPLFATNSETDQPTRTVNYPEEDYWRAANKIEYDFCIHEKGL